MPIKTETVWKKFADCFEIPLPISNKQKMKKIQEHVYHLMVDILKGRYDSIQCWKYLMPTMAYYIYTA